MTEEQMRRLRLLQQAAPALGMGAPPAPQGPMDPAPDLLGWDQVQAGANTVQLPEVSVDPTTDYTVQLPEITVDPTTDYNTPPPPAQAPAPTAPAPLRQVAGAIARRSPMAAPLMQAQAEPPPGPPGPPQVAAASPIQMPSEEGDGSRRPDPAAFEVGWRGESIPPAQLLAMQLAKARETDRGNRLIQSAVRNMIQRSTGNARLAQAYRPAVEADAEDSLYRERRLSMSERQDERSAQASEHQRDMDERRMGMAEQSEERRAEVATAQLAQLAQRIESGQMELEERQRHEDISSRETENTRNLVIGQLDMLEGTGFPGELESLRNQVGQMSSWEILHNPHVSQALQFATSYTRDSLRRRGGGGGGGGAGFSRRTGAVQSVADAMAQNADGTWTNDLVGNRRAIRDNLISLGTDPVLAERQAREAPDQQVLQTSLRVTGFGETAERHRERAQERLGKSMEAMDNINNAIRDAHAAVRNASDTDLRLAVAFDHPVTRGSEAERLRSLIEGARGHIQRVRTGLVATDAEAQRIAGEMGINWANEPSTVRVFLERESRNNESRRRAILRSYSEEVQQMYRGTQAVGEGPRRRFRMRDGTTVELTREEARNLRREIAP